MLGSFRLSNRAFAVAPGATALVACAKRGSAFRFSLSEAATVVIAIQRGTPGVRKGRSCVKPSSRVKGKRCTRYAKVGQLTRSATAGPNEVTFSGRLGRRALKPGAYRATASATDAAGNRSETATAAFKIVRR